MFDHTINDAIFQRACRACGVRPPRLFGSPAVDTPLAFGLLRPAVLLPETRPPGACTFIFTGL